MSLRSSVYLALVLFSPPFTACTLDVYSEPNARDGGEVTRGSEDDAGGETCDDGVRNGDEKGVDCGGSCTPCASCSDGKRNQGESDVDCGGPCDACETDHCSDGKRNEDEEGIDCGGSCDACAAEPSCDDGKRNQDEVDVDCGGVCDPCPATCEDGEQNQDESGVDCGGPCDPCGTCDDGELNQNEDAVDCGGVCPACPTCDDGVRNQDETRVDCGGACRACPLPGNARFIGNITQGGQLLPDFSLWNQLTPENEGKWRYLEPLRDEMNWEQMDAYYAYTRERGIPLKAHTFCWGSQAPDWIEALPPEEQAAEVEELIREFCGRYPSVELIDVVNEPDHAPPVFLDALGGAGETGHDWVLQCFEWAREYCPDSTLILNDYNVLRWDTDEFIAIAEKVQATGFLDAVGAQGHGLETISMSELEHNLSKVADLGVPIYISEYDVDVEDDDTQLYVYSQQFPLLYNHPQVAGLTLWGYVQGQTWKDYTYLQNLDGTRRPAFDWLLENFLSGDRICGDESCDDGETCEVCSLDCGACD